MKPSPIRPFTVEGGAVRDVGAGAAVAGNTGNGTITAAPATSADTKAGIYRIVCTTAAANGGLFNVFDPDGVLLGVATVGVAFTTHLTFTIADGSGDFAVGDAFTITVQKQLAVGSTIKSTKTASVIIPVLGAQSVRICAKLTAAATLKAYRLRPDGVTRSAIGNPNNVALVANTENKMDITLTGESHVEIEIAADQAVDTVVTFVDVNIVHA